MEAKKTAKADLENKKGLFFSISLLLSMGLVIMAFEWKQSEDKKDVVVTTTRDIFEETIEVPPTEIPPPPPKTVEQPEIIEVPDEKEIEQEIEVRFDIEVTEETKVQELIHYEAPKEIEEEHVDQIFIVVEQGAAPKGGMAAFYRDVGERLKYPAQARRMGIEGKVFVQFVINRDGSITDVSVIKGIGAGCDEEAVRVVAESPAWNPGKQRGRPVRQRMVLPIAFKLANNNI